MGPTITIPDSFPETGTELLPKETNSGEENNLKSMWQIVWEQFLEHRFAVFGLMVIGFFILMALLAPVISSLSGIDPNTQNVYYRYKGPLSFVPFPTELQEKKINEFVKEFPQETAEISLKIQSQFPEEFTVGSGESISDFLSAVSSEIENNEDFKKSFEEKAKNNSELKEFVTFREGFKTFHLLGTDELGRDVCMRLIYGTRISIGIGLIVALASAFIGLIIGSLSGYYGGLIDSCLMRVTDSLLSLPLLPVLIVFAAIDLRKIPFIDSIMNTEGESIFKLVFILCLFSWMTVARLVRGSILSIKEREFIQAAQTLGAKDSIIIFKHIVPNIIAPLLVAVTLNIGQSILSEAALSFLGLGIQPPVPSWGNMLFNAQELIYEAPLQAIIPGLLILIIVVSFNFVGDGLQDAIDPRSIKR